MTKNYLIIFVFFLFGCDNQGVIEPRDESSDMDSLNMRTDSIRAYSPKHKTSFSHALHESIDCVKCHTEPVKGSSTPQPSPTYCLTCHKVDTQPDPTLTNHEKLESISIQVLRVSDSIEAMSDKKSHRIIKEDSNDSISCEYLNNPNMDTDKIDQYNCGKCHY